MFLSQVDGVSLTADAGAYAGVNASHSESVALDDQSGRTIQVDQINFVRGWNEIANGVDAGYSHQTSFTAILGTLQFPWAKK